jgi:transposase InsO family protein
MESLYREVGISRQAHHKNKVMTEKRLSYSKELVLQVKQARTARPRMGSRLLHRLLGVKGTGINRFEQPVRREGLGIKRKRNYRKTADGYKFQGRSVNLLNNKEVNGVNQVWVTDITYFTVSSKPFYIIRAPLKTRHSI